MGTEGEEGYVPGDTNTAPPDDTYTYLDLAEAKVGHSIEPADKTKYQFAGWRVKGTSGPIYQPGQTFAINSDLAEEDSGIQYITLEPVFIQIGDALINYVINAPDDADIISNVLTDVSNNQQILLKDNSSVDLSSGNGFSVAGYKLIGWSDQELDPNQNSIELKNDVTYEGTIPDGAHIFKLGGTYGVSDSNTLYAVWELTTTPVPFTKQGENVDGTYSQLAGAEFRLYTDAACTSLASDVYGKIAETDAVVTSTDVSGTNVTFPKVPIGTYYFKETGVGNEYKLDSTVHTVTVTESDEGTLSYTIDGIYTSSDSLVIKNYRKGTLVVTKTVDSVVDSDSTKEFSFTATVLNGSGQTDSTVTGTYGDVIFANGVATFTLTHEGEKKIRDLGGRTIRIKEYNAEVYTTTASTGSIESGSYDSDSKTYTITVPNDGDTVAFTNKLEGVPVKILKVDQTLDALEGAVFYFTGKDFDGNEEPDVDNKTRYTSTKATAESEEAVIIYRAAVPPGTYTLHEEIVPADYMGLDGDVEITISSGAGGRLEASMKIGGTDITNPRFISQEADGTWVIKIMNSEGIVLPSTGGPGTNFIYLLGTILTVLAGAGLVMKKRHIV